MNAMFHISLALDSLCEQCLLFRLNLLRTSCGVDDSAKLNLAPEIP